MTTDNWINLIAAILVGGGTLALAFMTWKSIRQTRRIREEDRELNFKLRLLDEVRDWAREAVKLGFLYERVKSKSEMSKVADMIEDVAKTTDVADMAAKIFVNELEAPVKNAMSFIKSYKKDPSKFASKEYFDSLHDLLKAINKAKRKLLQL